MFETKQVSGEWREARVDGVARRRPSASGSGRRWRRLAGVASLVLAGCGGEPLGREPAGREPLGREPLGREPGGGESLPAGGFQYDAPFPGRTPLPSTPPFGSPTALADFQLAGRGRKEPVGEQFLQLRLSEPLVGRWRIADPLESPPKGGPRIVWEPSELRLEVRLLPRSLPRWRLVGSSSLNAARDSTWLEFVQSKSDQVLKLKVDCRWTNCLELVVSSHFQLGPEAAPVPLTPANRHKAEQFTQFMGQRLTTQLQWLTARGGGGAGGGRGGTGAAKMVELKKQLEQQLKVVESARLRLEHLATLQQTLEQEGRVHVRLVSPATGEEVPLAPWEPGA